METPETIDNTPWYILGAGAMGLLWGARLAMAGEPVVLLLRNRNRLNEFRAGGGILLEQQGEIIPVNVKTAIAGEPGRTIKRLLVCTKTFDTLDALEQVRNRLDEHALVILMQNGLGIQQQAQQYFKHLPLVCGITTEGVYRRSAFHIVYAGAGYTRLGSLARNPADVKLGRCELLAPLLTNGKLNISWDEDILSSLWLKLAINCAINPATALAGCKTGELLDNPEKMTEIKTLCSEIEQLLVALNVSSHGSLYDQVRQIMQATAANYSSMCQDVRNCRRTEIDAITGYLCAQARQLELDTPANDFFYKRIKTLESEIHSAELK